MSFSQSLHLAPAAARQGDSFAIEVTFNAPEGYSPQVLQWETTIPTAQWSFLDNQTQTGPAAQASDKSVTCALRTGPPETRTLACILAGGLKTIPNGVVALLRLRILPDAPTGATQVNAGHAVAVLPGLKEVALPSAEATVTVRPASDAGISKK
jgi:hypothetical protein